eukprot:TRINITY_DN8304_c0_g1_i1.p1 TRINITY_DN8304_c0_g1~~TRINITY_DN8304_c0_g1_i1.p1  ORF type:complete len:208 (-),score=38.48 TRINITY_DN8304_c0_g1_i1:170-739(-)
MAHALLQTPHRLELQELASSVLPRSVCNKLDCDGDFTELASRTVSYDLWKRLVDLDESVGMWKKERQYVEVQVQTSEVIASSQQTIADSACRDADCQTAATASLARELESLREKIGRTNSRLHFGQSTAVDLANACAAARQEARGISAGLQRRLAEEENGGQEAVARVNLIRSLVEAERSHMEVEIHAA